MNQEELLGELYVELCADKATYNIALIYSESHPGNAYDDLIDVLKGRGNTFQSIDSNSYYGVDGDITYFTVENNEISATSYSDIDEFISEEIYSGGKELIADLQARIEKEWYRIEKEGLGRIYRPIA